MISKFYLLNCRRKHHMHQVFKMVHVVLRSNGRTLLRPQLQATTNEPDPPRLWTTNWRTKVTLHRLHSHSVLHACSSLSKPNLSFGNFLSDRERDPAELPSDDSKLDGDGTSAKRRHSRPLELDSEGEEEVDTSGKEESLSDREEEPVKMEVAERLSLGKVSRLQNERGGKKQQVYRNFVCIINLFVLISSRRVGMRGAKVKMRETYPVKAPLQIRLMMVLQIFDRNSWLALFILMRFQ